MGARRGAGRPRKSLEDHLAEGTYRATRHRTWSADNVVDMPRPPAPEPAPESPVDPKAALRGLGKAGRAWMAEHLTARTDWSSRDVALLRQAAENRDRQVAAQKVIKDEGEFVKGPGGRSVPHPALAIEQRCSTAIMTALRALEVKAGGKPAAPAGKGAAVPANPLDKYLNRRQR